MSHRVAVIGAAGHVGLPLALVLAEHGNETVGIDINAAAVEEINDGTMPFYEEGADVLLRECLATGTFTMTTDLSRTKDEPVRYDRLRVRTDRGRGSTCADYRFRHRAS